MIATGSRLAAGLEGNPHFPNPQPTVDELKARLAALETAQEEYRRERQRLNELQTALEQTMRELKQALAASAEYVEEASGGDAAKILSANLSVERSWSFWPFGSLPQVLELSASHADVSGEVDLVWDPVREAHGYEVQCTTDLGGDDRWVQCAVAKESRVTVKDLTPRCRYWFRVRAVGEKSPGDWSDEVTKYAR